MKRIVCHAPSGSRRRATQSAPPSAKKVAYCQPLNDTNASCWKVWPLMQVPKGPLAKFSAFDTTTESDNGFNFMVEDPTVRPMVIANQLPFNPLKMPPERLEQMVSNGDGVQFSHTLEEQIGGQLRAGLVLTDVYEDTSNEPDAIADGIPAFWATRAVKPVVRDGWTCFRRYDDA